MFQTLEKRKENLTRRPRNGFLTNQVREADLSVNSLLGNSYDVQTRESRAIPASVRRGPFRFAVSGHLHEFTSFEEL